MGSIAASEDTHRDAHTTAQWPAASPQQRRPIRKQKALFSRVRCTVQHNSRAELEERWTCSQFGHCRKKKHRMVQCSNSNWGNSENGDIFKGLFFRALPSAGLRWPPSRCTFHAADKANITSRAGSVFI